MKDASAQLFLPTISPEVLRITRRTMFTIRHLETEGRKSTNSEAMVSRKDPKNNIVTKAENPDPNRDFFLPSTGVPQA